MSSIRVSLREPGGEVRLEVEDLEPAALAELEHLMLSLQTQRVPGGYSLTVASFRRAAVQIARHLQQSDAQVELDDGVTELLRLQLAEIRARPHNTEAVQPLTQAEVVARLAAAGRLRAEPNERQFENLGRLLALAHGANFSVPGAGKTFTLLAIYEAERAAGTVDRLLVVAPKNAFISWEEEVERCFQPHEWPVVARLSGGQRGVRVALQGNPEIALITYQLLVNVSEQVDAWARRHRLHVTLDESHRIKGGYGGVTASAALELSQAAVRRDILSGTPLPQSAEDLRPQLEFLWPGQRILPDPASLRTAEEVMLEQVRGVLDPLYVRTTKTQLELPDLHVSGVGVTLGPLQRELYEVLRSEAARAASGMSIGDQRFFRTLGQHVMRLLQAAVNPMLLTRREIADWTGLEPVPEGTRAWELLRELARYERPAKLAAAVVRAEQLIGQGEKVLIWSQFVMNVTSLERLLAAHGAVVLHGGVPVGDERDPATREGRIRRFHDDPQTMVMIANPAAAGEGISLHRACQHAIYLDRSFNAAHYLQSVDRIHRLGLDPDAEPTVEILEARGTVDQRVNERLTAKVRAMEVVLNDRGLAALAYDPEDVTDEFPGGIQPGDVQEILDHLKAPRED
jgi:SNF2 family DNA or RNA helicase